ncbi:hypothetical protein LIER_41098 [Lithospermum erythrorhizon]|uniref:Reverse transcriptase domain-containing protein n=1 Tax=Lithospermum erythrorhizon TaxID=34254 RepID=A0AAV3R7E3_LITER
MPKHVNSTAISLLPEVQNPQSMRSFRPIACCNSIYKIISSILAARLKVVLHIVIGLQQTVYVPGRRITDGILIMQELMARCHKESGAPRCAIKVDIVEAYDTVRWDFLWMIIRYMKFPETFIRWIKGQLSFTGRRITSNILKVHEAMSGLRCGRKDVLMWDNYSQFSCSKAWFRLRQNAEKPGTWEEEISFMVEKCSGRGLKERLSRVAFCTVIYYVWIERNCLISKDKSNDVELVFLSCFSIVHTKGRVDQGICAVNGVLIGRVFGGSTKTIEVVTG